MAALRFVDIMQPMSRGGVSTRDHMTSDINDETMFEHESLFNRIKPFIRILLCLIVKTL
jgi:hypothetical protein